MKPNKGSEKFVKYYKSMGYPNGIENSQAFANAYRLAYGNSTSEVVFTRLKENLSESNGIKHGFYYSTHGVLINFFAPYDEEKNKEFLEKVLKLAEEYDNICQVSKSVYVKMAVPEHIRRKNVIARMIKNNSSQARIERYKKSKKLKIDYFFKGKITKTTRDVIKNLTPNVYGEYFKNVQGVELVAITDGGKISKEVQSKTIPPELFYHLIKFELIEIIEDREFYKKFYFREEFIKNFRKYIRFYRDK